MRYLNKYESFNFQGFSTTEPKKYIITNGKIPRKWNQLKDGVEYLYCCKNEPKMRDLPSLPEGLRLLYCNGNDLKSIPELPSTLEVLECEYNLIKQLPKLPNGLKKLMCDNNRLTELPELPDSLIELSCFSNNWYNPIKYDYYKKFSFKLHNVYTKSQIEIFSSYDFQKVFLTQNIENYLDLEPIGYNDEIKIEFDYLFSGGDIGLLGFKNAKL